MPGWHGAVKAFEGLQTVGIVEEQHGDRAQLFMQWKEMDWPVFADLLNLLEVPYVPITLFIDEYGVIQKVSPSLRNGDAELKAFLETKFTAPKKISPHLGLEVNYGKLSYMLYYSDFLFLWGETNRCIHAYQKTINRYATEHLAHFRLGVAYRKRFDSPLRVPGDFQNAINHWEAALALAPKNYIYWRRIQQYGPRLEKPYAFYDWVEKAHEEILARGETPVPLKVMPRGAELTRPMRRFKSAQEDQNPPDPDNKVPLDHGLIEVETVTVPSAVEPGKTARVHLLLRPAKGIHWSNRQKDLTLWADAPDGWMVNRRLHRIPNPVDQSFSRETRHVEFEIITPKDAAGVVEVSCVALYVVCEGKDRPQLYRRKNLQIPIAMKRTKQ